ncbi:RhuM family protein [Desulfatirhabdium butyrativorans]|uniref:RhuM family protein n=1 Tax=Desulfatirhabdium butyrativorans TaxID=340467 RepID=UPI0024817C62|nr:RhuM family protein [Desulfatirhabdium butyrativorans]
MDREATAEESSVVQIEGSREVRRLLTLYNLDAIFAVGYRVRSTLPYKPQRGVIRTARGNAPGQIRRKKTLSPERAT